MQDIIVTGQTFQHRNQLRALGGRWNASEQAWEFFDATKRTVEQVKELIGCSVVEQNKPIVAIWNDNEHNSIIRNGNTIIYGDDESYLNYFKDKNPIAFYGFSSLEKYVNFVEQTPKREDGWNSRDKNWTGTQNMSAALRLARHGWPEGVENAAAVLDMLSTDHATKRRRQLGVTGGHVSVGRLLSGNPVHMVKRPKQPGKQIVTLFVETGNSCAISSDTMITRAAIIAAIADILESEGYSCEIIATWICASHHLVDTPAAQFVITIKHAGEKLNLNNTVFSLGHPSFLRRLHFAAFTACNELSHLWYNMGYTRNGFNETYMPTKNEFYIPYIDYDVSGSTLREKAFSIIDDVKPLNLPMEIMNNANSND